MMMTVVSICREKMILIRKELGSRNKVGKDKYERNNKEFNGNNEKDKHKRKGTGRYRCRRMRKHAFVSKNKWKLKEEKNSSKS